MKRNKKKEQPTKKPLPQPRDPLFDIHQAASMTECTGALPAQIETGEQGQAISAMESIHTIQPPDGEKPRRR